MTRLTEALERAHLVPAPSLEPGPAPKPGDDALRTWQFGAELELRPAAPNAQTAPVVAPPLRDVPIELRDKLITGGHTEAALAEQYRRVAAALHHAQTQRGLRSVMIASAVAAEGKTLTATNVSLTLSHSLSRRVLLVDGDLRRPTIHKMFGVSNERGLIDTFGGSQNGRLPVVEVAENLWVLPAGRPTADPMSELVSDTMKQLIADAVAQFDWVIVDTPPVALMPDANLLAATIDAALLVISANSTPYPLVQKAVAAIGPQRVLGIILNRADRSAIAHEYGYYGYYDRERSTGDSKRFQLFGR